MSLHAVIMAGGVGSRFWPRSRRAMPKQFLDVLDESSLLQNTLGRLQPLVDVQNVHVVTHTRYVVQTREALPALPEENILAEPSARNTAPCIAFAASRLLAVDPDATMIVLPADHVIRNVARFHTALAVAAEKAQDGVLVTIGIEPTHPETGYGYIQFEGEAGYEPRPVPVVAFAEKPDMATAERFIDAGDFLWNSGMFVWRADAILKAMAQHLPAVHNAFVSPATDLRDDASLRAAYERSPRISIDYGVMEPAAAAGQVYVVPASLGWSDVGDWRAVFDLLDKDDAGNAVEGNVIVHDARQCYARSDGRLVVLIGVENLAVVDTEDAILVTNLDHTQQVKTVVDYLGSRGMKKFL